MILRAMEAGGGAPVALLHGLFGAGRNFGALQRTLASEFRTIALDLRNHGDSPHGVDMRYATLATDALETLAERHALPAALLGHSMGGKVAMRLALDAPDRVRCLVVADIAPRPYRPAFRDIASALQALPLTPELTRAAADRALAPALPEPGLRAFLVQNLRLGAIPAWRIGLAEIAAAMPDIEDWPSDADRSYAGPTLFVTGSTSGYVREEDRPAIRRLFPAARFVALKGAGHWLHTDSPVAFADTVAAFLRSVLSG